MSCGKLSSAAGTHSLLDDVEALLVNLERGHLLDDLLQQDVLLVAVAFDGQLRQAGKAGHVAGKRRIGRSVEKSRMHVNNLTVYCVKVTLLVCY